MKRWVKNWGISNTTLVEKKKLTHFFNRTSQEDISKKDGGQSCKLCIFFSNFVPSFFPFSYMGREEENVVNCAKAWRHSHIFCNFSVSRLAFIYYSLTSRPHLKQIKRKKWNRLFSKRREKTPSSLSFFFGEVFFGSFSGLESANYSR